MAREKRNYARYNPEVFEVGRRQAMNLLHGDWGERVFRYGCDYLVVCALSWFGDGAEVQEYDGCTSLSDAIEIVELNHEQDSQEFDGLLDCGTDYEIWRLVDDSSLWDEWESRVAESRRSACCHVEVDLSGCACEAERWFRVADGLAVAACPHMGYEVHNVDWKFMPWSGSVYELSVFYSDVVQVFRFPSESGFYGFLSDMGHILCKHPHYGYAYEYDRKGVVSSDEVVTFSPDDVKACDGIPF